MRYGKFSYTEILNMDIEELTFWQDELLKLSDEEEKILRTEL